MKSLKLNTLASENLSKIEMNKLQGGITCCGCACAGISSTNDNCDANAKGGKSSTKPAVRLKCDGVPIDL
jgi:natural product precursor